MAKKLTPKEKLFVEYFVTELNATQAAIKAGYSQKTAGVIGYENLKKPHIQEELKKSLEKKFVKAELDGQRVLDNLKEIADVCMQKKPVIVRVLKLNKNGKQVIRERVNEEALREYDPAGANAALDKLGKYYKLFTDGTTNNVHIDVIKVGQK